MQTKSHTPVDLAFLISSLHVFGSNGNFDEQDHRVDW